MRGLGLCRVLIDLGWEQPNTDDHPEISQERRLVAARRTIFYQNEILDCVPVICEGWAASVLKLSNGRQQILSFLLPGDIVSCGLLFERQLRLSIDAVTRSSYRCFDRAQLRAAMFVSPKFLDRILSAYDGERTRGDQLIADLGRRTAAERVARLILNIRDRLEMSGMVEDDSIEFPLRQTHIADATGLTPAYVNKVLGDFRNDGLVKISRRALKIIDMKQLRRLAA